MVRALRFGVIGTGPWASAVHVPSVRDSDHVEFAGVLGRDLDRAQALAGDARGFTDVGEFLDAVDLVGFAVPPEVQVDLATTAIRAGKHVLLEKPVAIDPDAATALAALASSRDIRSLVFFTHRFSPDYADWLSRTRASGPWILGRVESYGSVLVDPASPFHDSPWRHARGALWDVGPHAIAQLCGMLGRVTSVRAERGPGDLTSLLLTHESGAQGSVSVAADLPSPPRGKTYFVGAHGRAEPPAVVDWMSMSRAAYGAAIAQLADESAAPHECDLEFGAHVTRVLAAAERSAASGRAELL
jgi:predicted dehydrogenase